MEEPGTRGGPRIEVRWFLAGDLPTGVTEWFAQFPSSAEAREDSYLVAPRLPGLTVKLRGGLALDVKLYRGNRGLLRIPGIAEGQLGSWSKWSFSFDAEVQPPEYGVAWRRVKKDRKLSTFVLDDRRLIAGLPASQDQLVCTAELSHIAVDDERWWTFAFESAGPADRQRHAIEMTADRFLRTDVPVDLQLTLEHCRPYTDWLDGLEVRGQ